MRSTLLLGRAKGRNAVIGRKEETRKEVLVPRTERFVIVDKKPAAESFAEDDPRDAAFH
jgi:hypothetical protein